MLKLLDEKTMMPVGLAIGIIGGCAIWVTKIDISMANAQAAIIEQKQVDTAYHSKVCALLESIDKRLSRIENIRRFKE